ncbi:hypothetical protein MAR_033490 [Mya arenaria]|uniref:Mitochondrial fission 1 protein n=1 Tax=Mya arenaria TaxID=6604 RepID=A0ABY7G930_MYAAR|nr:hypothetical protein MAR_033490 [Mya arenaria]
MAVYNHKLKNWGFLLKRFVQRNNIDQAFIFQPKGNKHGNLGTKTTAPAAFVMAGAVLVTGDDYDSKLLNYLQRRGDLFETNNKQFDTWIKLAYYELMIHNYTASEQLFLTIIAEMKNSKGYALTINEGYLFTICLSALLGLANINYLRGNYKEALRYCNEVVTLGEETLEVGMAKQLKEKIERNIQNSGMFICFVAVAVGLCSVFILGFR